ncbi:MAG TPA: adenylate/guanylate cyclase domain-containing protein [Candidatus Methylomirabilis sp.]|nr:adenylate/guanylate cyclase domain-containing protein [Candidatus Methylomirabilis sp.]
MVRGDVESANRSAAAWVRLVRLSSGLVLLTYVTTHLVNHALGLVSLAAMESGRDWFLWLWRSRLGTVLLYGALVTHLLLALWSLYQRRHLRIPAWEALQLLLGLSIPPLLAMHIVMTRLASDWYDATDSYTAVVLGLWYLTPAAGVRQAITLLLAWIHGCIGVHFWLRLKSWYSRVAPVLFSIALLLPVLALLGFVQGGREVSAMARQPGWVEMMQRTHGVSDLAARGVLEGTVNGILGTFGAALAATLVAREARRWIERRRGVVRISYPGDRVVVVPVGITVLEASRLNGIPHASVCGGRGRCSTCRVRVTRGLNVLPPASREEFSVLTRVGLPPNVRLACQLRPTHNVTVIRLLPASARPSDGFPKAEPVAGAEQEIAVLFADLREFTRVAERKFPYDVVFLLNRYFEAVGGAIARAGGIANQFTGDGVMALFGVGADPDEGCRHALMAAGEIVRAVRDLSQSLTEELSRPLRIGIGIHTGSAVVGRMGYGETTYLTAVGDTVHVASRLQDLTKQYDCQLVISKEVAERAGADMSSYPGHELAVRNRSEPVLIHVVDDVGALLGALEALQAHLQAPGS